jgi:hypothetical protein
MYMYLYVCVCVCVSMALTHSSMSTLALTRRRGVLDSVRKTIACLNSLRASGTQFTCFTSKKVQILAQPQMCPRFGQNDGSIFELLASFWVSILLCQ